MDTELPYTGVFVIQFSRETDIPTGRIDGRIEHVASTRTARFRSRDELLAAIAHMLDGRGQRGPAKGPTG